MTVLEPIPGNYGKADWVDYSNYWREADAEWIQARSILRYDTDAARNTDQTSPGIGQVVYNEAADALQLRSKTGVWKSYAGLPVNLVTILDTPSAVTLANVGGAGKGVVFTPTDVQISHNFKVLTNVLTVDTTGLTLKTGTKVAKLTTDAANLLSDTPLSVPSLALTGTGTVFSAPGKAVTVGTLTADNVTLGAGTVTGALTAGSGTIGNVLLAASHVEAAQGYVSQSGYFYGNGNSAIMRSRDPGTGNPGSPYMQSTTSDNIISSILRYYGGGNGIAYYDATSAFRGWISPAIWGGDPGVNNVPEGTIWVG